MIYAVIDTNVLVAGLISRNDQSPTVQIIRLMIAGRFTPLYNDEIMMEYKDVLKRKKFKISETLVDLLTDYIIENGVETTRTLFPGTLPDEDDRVFLEVSLSNKDSFLVTGNLKHFPSIPQVVTPSDFLKLLK